MTNFSSLKLQAELALAKISEGKCYVLSDLSHRLQKVADSHPQDIVIISMARIVEQLNNKHAGEIISQNDIEKLYNQLVGLNSSGTKFREVLGDLLISEKVLPNATNTDFINQSRNSESLPFEMGDKKIKEECDKLFETNAVQSSPKIITAAKRKIELEMQSLGYNNARVNFAGGDSKFLVFSADLDTARGKVRIHIPADASGQQLPSVFYADDELQELSLPVLKSYLANANIKTVSSHSVGEIKVPNIGVPEPLKDIVSHLEESLVESTIGYPKEALQLTKHILATELNSMGFKNSQVKVASSTTDGFICEAIIDTPNGKIAIEIPIEMRGNMPLCPSVFAKGDFVADFNEANLKSFAMNNVAPSSLILREDSHLPNMDILQLKDLIIRAAIGGDFETCDNALAVIGSKFDAQTYKTTIAEYSKMLLNFNNTKDTIKVAYNDNSQFVMTPNSIYPMHKKLGKPINELICDENGEYHLKSTYISRQNQKAQAVLFNTGSKILIGD